MTETLMGEQERISAALDEGTTCRACGQHAQRYRRKINAGMARALIALYRAGGRDARRWVHKPTALSGLGAAARDEALLRFWGLIEESQQPREDGGRSGWWRLTPRGAGFVQMQETVSSHAWIYNGEFVRYDGAPVTIAACLGDRFNYEELLHGGSPKAASS